MVWKRAVAILAGAGAVLGVTAWQAAERAGAAHGFDWSGEQVRTFMMGLIASGVGLACRLLWSMRDRLGVLHRDIRGDEKNRGLMDIVAENTHHIEQLQLRNYKMDILEAVESDLHTGPDRRRGPRRIRDQMADTYEHPTPREEKK